MRAIDAGHDEPLKAMRGFTLLEAIVAVAIIGACLMPIMGFISQSVLQLQRAGDANARSMAEENVLNFLEVVNPLTEPQGRVVIGDLNVTWTSRALVPPNTNVRIGTGLPQHAVGFYQVDVSVARGGGPEWFFFSARKIGHQRLNMIDAMGMPQ